MPDHTLHGGRHRATTTGPGRVATAARVTTAATAVTAAALGTLVAGPLNAQAASDTAASDTASSATGSPASPSAAPEQSPAARAAHAEPLVPGTPCSASARACVDLETQRAWLIDGGEVVRGPMRVTTGARGDETPLGHSFRVYRHDADHVSEESRTPDGDPAPMPYSTFFADGGVAFHGGSLERASAGCVHMRDADAKALYGFLRNGDKVQVVNGSQERAARAAAL